MSTCIMPFNFYEPYDRDKFHNYIRTLKQADDENLEAYLLEQIPEQVVYKRQFSDYNEVYYLRESIKKMIDKLGRSYMKTQEEEDYLELTRKMNQFKDRLNEIEKEKIELRDKLHDLDKEIDKTDEEYRKALDAMLTASSKVK
jgi:predicted nuclease with TOPRIM domain